MSDPLDYRHYPTLRLRYMIDDYDTLLRQIREKEESELTPNTLQHSSYKRDARLVHAQ